MKEFEFSATMNVSFYTIRRIAFKEEKQERGTPPLRRLAVKDPINALWWRLIQDPADRPMPVADSRPVA